MTNKLINAHHEILDIAQHPVSLDETFDKRIQEWHAQGCDLSVYSYAIPAQIINMDGSSMEYRMDLLKRLIKSPLFKFDPLQHPYNLMYTLAACSFWLRS